MFLFPKDQNRKVNQMPNVKDIFKFSNRDVYIISNSLFKYSKHYPDITIPEFSFNSEITTDAHWHEFKAFMSQFSETYDLDDSDFVSSSIGMRTNNYFQRYVESHLISFLAYSSLDHIRFGHSVIDKSKIKITVRNHVIDTLVKNNFDVVIANEDKSLIGKASLTDDRGRVVHMKVGKAMRKMFPRLPLSFITHMVEGINDFIKEKSKNYYVHEGYSADHFAYAYMKATQTDESPRVSKPHTMSLISSCLRGSVKTDRFGMNKEILQTGHNSTEVRNVGVHPAEAYASGDFSIVYLSDKKNPFDPAGTVYARCVVTHFQFDRDKLRRSKLWDIPKYKGVVNVSPIYISSEFSHEFMKNYLEQKYEYVSRKLYTVNHCPYMAMYNFYNADKDADRTSYFDYLPKEVVKSIDRALVRPPRLNMINTNGKQITVAEHNAITDASITVIAPYLDKHNIDSMCITTGDENGMSVETDNQEGFVYSYITTSHKVDRDLIDTTRYFREYSGTNYASVYKAPAVCDLTQVKVKKSRTLQLNIIADGFDPDTQYNVTNDYHSHGFDYFGVNGKTYLYNTESGNEKSVRWIYEVHIRDNKLYPYDEATVVSAEMFDFLTKLDMVYKSPNGVEYITKQLDRSEHVKLFG